MMQKPKLNKTKPFIASLQRFTSLTMRLIDKMEITDCNMGKCTIFINKKHTLAHVLFKSDDVLMRVPIKARLLREPDHVVQTYMSIRLAKHLNDFKF